MQPNFNIEGMSFLLRQRLHNLKLKKGLLKLLHGKSWRPNFSEKDHQDHLLMILLEYYNLAFASTFLHLHN